MRNADARIILNGAQVASIGPGSFIMDDIEPGASAVSVNAFGTTTCTVSFSAQPGETEFFEITPGEPGRVVRLSGAFGLLGAAATSAVSQCNELIIQQVQRQVAVQALANTRLIPLSR